MLAYQERRYRMKECLTCKVCYEDEKKICPADGSALSFSWPGTRNLLGKYLLQSVIGKGGMGVVFLAEQIELKRQVAVKVLSPLFLNSAQALKRFRTEAMAAGRLDHPNIIKVYDYGTLPGDGGAYLVMKLLRGYSLTSELMRVGPLPFLRIQAIMQQLCSAVQVAHNSHIVHCDLKPDNIIIERNEKNQEYIQIVDFGIARLRDVSGTGSLYSIHTGTSVGTPSYMSPEQCLGEKLFAQSDIYSLGIILYEMLSGTVPFKSLSAADVALHHIRTDPLPPSHFRSNICPELDQVVLTALAKAPEARYESVLSFFLALEDALKINEQRMAYMLKPSRTEELVSDVGRFAFAIDEEAGKGSSSRKTDSTKPNTSPLPELPFKPVATPSPQPALKNINVLVVDDEEEVLDVLCKIIERLGSTVITARDGDEAWQKLKTQDISLIISDVMMPNVDGWQFFFRYKIDPAFAEIPFIFITSHVIQDEKISALEQGVEEYWVKPFNIPEVTVRIKRLLQRVAGHS